MLNRLIFRPVIEKRLIAVAAGLKFFYENADESKSKEESDKFKPEVKVVKTPSLDDHVFTEAELEKPGELASDAAKIVMKMLYGARLVRYDLLWPICSIARQISKWSAACDRRLFRLVSYLNCTLDHSLEGFVGDSPDQCHVVMCMLMLKP